MAAAKAERGALDDARTDVQGAIDPAIDPVIDLGDLSAGSKEVASRWRASGWVRYLPAALVLLAVALLVTSSAAYLPALLDRPLWTDMVPVSRQLALGPDVLYVYEGEERLTAREARTGEPLWQLDTGERLPIIDPGGGLTVLDPPDGGFLFLSTTTGEVVYESTARGDQYLGVVAGELHLAARPVDGRPGCATGERCIEIRAFTFSGSGPGLVAWRLLAGRGASIEVGYGVASEGGRAITGLAVIEADQAAIIDAGTGTITATVAADPGTDHLLLDGRLVTLARQQDQWQVTARDLGGSGGDWSLSLPRPADWDTNALWLDAPRLSACGGLLCVATAYDTTLVDPATGQVRLTVVDFQVVAVGDGIQLVRVDPAPYDLVADTQIRMWPVGGRLEQAVWASPVRWYGSGERGLLTHYGDQGTEVLLLEASGALTSLGTLNEPGSTCTAYGQLLACAVGTTLQAFRLP